MPKIDTKNAYAVLPLSDLQDLLKTIAPGAIMVVTDKKVKRLWLEKTGLGIYPCHILPSGEHGKAMKEIEKIWQKMVDLNLDRKSLLITLGGGAISDAAGFAASTYKRGIKIINVPTTLLAMTDASHGGKTAINFAGLKNTIGSFAIPEAVIIEPNFLSTQSEKQRLNGLAEMLKHGLIASSRHWEMLWDYPELNWEKAIHDSIAIKLKIAMADPSEQGPRKSLNFGHTFGHAIESLWSETNVKPLPHGYAIAAGMIMETYFSIKAGLSQNEHDQIVRVLLAFYGKLNLTKLPFDKIWKKMLGDKKNEANTVMCTVLTAIGKPLWDSPIEKKDARLAYLFYQNL